MERKSLLADNAMTTLETMLDFLGITETDDSTKNKEKPANKISE